MNADLTLGRVRTRPDRLPSGSQMSSVVQLSSCILVSVMRTSSDRESAFFLSDLTSTVLITLI